MFVLISAKPIRAGQGHIASGIRGGGGVAMSPKPRG